MLQAGALVNALGTGMVTPFVVIYLHDVRGFPLAVSGLVVAVFGAVSLVSTWLAGGFVDRRGARLVVLASLGLLALGYGLFPLARAPWQAVLFMVLAGLGNGATWPAQSTLMLGLTPAERRNAAFSLTRTAGNLGLGLGGVLGGLLATTARPSSFTLLFVADAATFLAFAALVTTLPRPGAPPRDANGGHGRWRDVLVDRTLLRIAALNTLLVVAGYAQLEAALPVFAKNQAHVTEALVGFLFLANVIAVVVAQMPVSRLLEGRRRMRALALLGVLWASAWLLVGAAGLWHAAVSAAAVLVLAVVVFGLGECLHPLVSTVTADLAPAHLRGRYLAVLTSSFAVGFTLGPAAAGLVLGLAPFALWPIAAGACLAAGAYALALERRLPEALRVTPSC